MKFFKSRLGLLVLGLAVLAALFLTRPGASRVKARVAKSVGLALGRQVEIGSARFRLLPRPGFDFYDFVVSDDAAFSAEPMLRAPEVTASLRLSSLLRGRLEISRLSLSEPSLNLVRDARRRWNLEDLLEHSAKVAVAPTGKPRSEPRPAFPYVEADQGRINFKLVQEKKPYTLTDAEFSLWQDSENTWAMRLRAQPLRTDLNLSDTGLLRADGKWQRANTLRETPLEFQLAWERGQLGQLSKFFSGRDLGWRGSVATAVKLSGSPEDLGVEVTGSVDDFRRFDIVGPDAVRLGARCTARYSSEARELRDLVCGSSVDQGSVQLRGSIANLADLRSYDLEVEAAGIPAQSLIRLARHIKKDLPEDSVASGTLAARFRVHRDPSAGPRWEGSGELKSLLLASASNGAQLELGTIPFMAAPANLRPARRNPAAGKTEPASAPSNRLEVGPFALPLGRPAPASARGWVARDGYNFTVSGDAQVRRLLQVARLLGVPAWQANADGMARMNLQVAGAWSGFQGAQVTGGAQLTEVRAQLRGVNAPLEIASASLLVDDSATHFTNMAGSLAGISLNASLNLPRRCASMPVCPVKFEAAADGISLAQLRELLDPAARNRPWYRQLFPSGNPGPSVLSEVRATGKLRLRQLAMNRLLVNDVVANVELDGGKVTLTGLQFDWLGGKHQGDWTADFTAQPPAYTGKGTFHHVSLARLAQLMGDGWIAGASAGSYELAMSGSNAAELLGAATASADIEVHDGGLPHLMLAKNSATRVRRFQGKLGLRNGLLSLTQGKLETGAGIYQVSGTASLGSQLNMRLVGDDSRSFTVTGTIAKPQVAADESHETQAELKP